MAYDYLNRRTEETEGVIDYIGIAEASKKERQKNSVDYIGIAQKRQGDRVYSKLVNMLNMDGLRSGYAELIKNAKTVRTDGTRSQDWAQNAQPLFRAVNTGRNYLRENEEYLKRFLSNEQYDSLFQELNGYAEQGKDAAIIGSRNIYGFADKAAETYGAIVTPGTRTSSGVIQQVNRAADGAKQYLRDSGLFTEAELREIYASEGFDATLTDEQAKQFAPQMINPLTGKAMPSSLGNTTEDEDGDGISDIALPGTPLDRHRRNEMDKVISDTPQVKIYNEESENISIARAEKNRGNAVALQNEINRIDEQIENRDAHLYTVQEEIKRYERELQLHPESTELQKQYAALKEEESLLLSDGELETLREEKAKEISYATIRYLASMQLLDKEYRKEADFKKYSAKDPDVKYSVSNGNEDMHYWVLVNREDGYANRDGEGKYVYLTQATEEEREVFSYLFQSPEHSRQEAMEYAELMKPIWMSRMGDVIAEDLDLPVLRELYGVTAGMGRAFQGAMQWFYDEAVPQNQMDYTLSALQERNQSGLSKYTLGAATSIGQMLPATAVGLTGHPGLAAAMTAATSGGATARDLMLNGVSAGQAKFQGALSGLAEAGTQKLLSGIPGLKGVYTDALKNKLMGKVSSGIGKALVNLGVNAAGEIVEEEIQLFLDPLFAVMAGTADSYETPEWQDALDVAIETLITIGVMDSVETASVIPDTKFTNDYAKPTIDALLELEKTNPSAYAAGLELQQIMDENGGIVTKGQLDAVFANHGLEADQMRRSEKSLYNENTADVFIQAAGILEEAMPNAYAAGQEIQTLMEKGKKVSKRQFWKVLDKHEVKLTEVAAKATEVEAMRMQNAAQDTGRTMDAPAGADGIGRAMRAPTGAEAQKNLNGGTENVTTGNDVSDGGQRGISGQSAGEQAGGVAKGTGRTAKAAQQRTVATERQNRVNALQEDLISPKEVGIRAGVSDKTLRIAREETWDNEQREVASQIEQKTGRKVTYVIGGIQVNTSDGVRLVRGVYTQNGIIIQADNMRVGIGKIANHEIFHNMARHSVGLVKDIESKIREKYPNAKDFDRVVDTYMRKLNGIIDVPENATPEQMDAALEIVMEEIFADAYAGINAFSANAPKYKSVVEEVLNERGIGKNSENAAATDRTNGPNEMYSISENILGEKGEYGRGVILDSNIFDGISPRNWGKVLGKYVYENLAGTEIAVYDENGNEETVYIAREKDRVTKAGAKNSHKVIDKLARYRGDNIRALATVHVSEVFVTSKYEKSTDEHSHQWMDDNGWEIRTVYLQDITGTIYEATLNIAKGRDRNIMYDINNIRAIDKNRASDGDVPSTETGRGSLINRSSGKRIAQSEKKVKKKSKKELRWEAEQRKKDAGEWTFSDEVNKQLWDHWGYDDEVETEEWFSADETDVEYLAAVERGDMETAQRMVDQAVKEAMPEAKTIDTTGKLKHYYHGTARTDRVGNEFRADRATSGPMAFFTDEKAIAENYAKDKSDTSMANDPDYDRYETQFRFKSKKGAKHSLDNQISKVWGYIPFAERRTIERKAGELRFGWDGEDDSALILEPGRKEANGGFAYQLKEYRGNVIGALMEQWLNSGNLFNEEGRFMEVLEKTGVTEALDKMGLEVYYKDPNFRAEGVYDVYLNVTNPVVTSELTEEFANELEAWWEEQDWEKYNPGDYIEADMWDKRSTSVEDWIERLKEDIKRDTTHAWTSIPDAVTDFLKEKGYDGIFDEGGKFHNTAHQVVIPFYSEQIKSAAPVTYDDDGNLIPLSERFNEGKTDIRFSVDEDFENETVVSGDTTLPNSADVGKGRDLYRPEGMSDEEYAELNARWHASEESRVNYMSAAAKAEAMKHISKENFVGTEALDKLGVKIENSVGIYQFIKSMIANDKAAKSIRRELKQAERRLNATEAEKDFAAGIAAGLYAEEDIPRSMDADTVMELADFYWAEKSVNADLIRQRREEINRVLRQQMAKLFRDSDKGKPSKMLVMNERTPERNMLHIFGDKQGAEINREIIEPVQTNEAERYRFVNRMYDEVRKFENKDGKRKKLNKEERALVQMVIEGKAVGEIVAGMEMSEAIKNAAENVKNGSDITDAAREFGLGTEERKLAVKYSRWLQTQEALNSDKVDTVKIDNAVKTYTELFNKFYDAINDFLVAHGYEPIGFIKGYAPHLQPETNQTLLNKALQGLGINTSVSKLPTSIAGLTANYKPNKRWNPYFLQRTGDATQYDIASAFESYVDYMSDVLYHTDDIMRIRQAVNYFRTTYAPDNIRENLEWAEELHYASTEEKTNFLRDNEVISRDSVLSPKDVDKQMEAYISDLYKKIENTSQYGEFVSYLENYANILAGKQSMADRGWEYTGGRTILNVGGKLTRAFSRAQVAGNLSSALNQTAQLSQITSELGIKYTSAAIRDVVRGRTRRAKWAQYSDFLTGKHGIDFIVNTKGEMILSGMFAPAQFVDGLMSTIAVRGKYLQEIKAGKSHAEAMRSADQFAKGIMASRMKGSRPLAYESKGLFSQMLHIFQTEAVNSWEHLSQDLPRVFRQIAEEKGKLAAARSLSGVIVKMLISAFVLNRLDEELYGGTPAPFDLLGLSANFIASGEGLTTNEWLRTVIDNGWEKMTGERLFGTDADVLDGEFDWGTAIEDTTYNVGNDIPFLRNAMALLGLGDGTLPLPDVWNGVGDIKDAIKNNGFISGETGKAFFEFVMESIPMGRQLLKTAQGLEAAARGGYYKGYGEDSRLQYPVEGDWWDYVQGGLFGRNATSENKSFWASGEKGLTENQTRLYDELVDSGANNIIIYNAIQDYRKIGNDESLTSYERGLQQRDMIRDLFITDQQKLELYRGLTGAENRAEKFQILMNEGMKWDQIMDVYDKYSELNADEENDTNRTTEFYYWLDGQNFNETQTNAVKEQFKFYNQAPESAERYEKATAAGMEDAYEFTEMLGDLEPEEGKDSVENIQRYRAAVDFYGDPEDQLVALSIVAPQKTTSAKFDIAYSFGVLPDTYVTLLEIQDEYNEDGKGSLKNDEVKKAIDHLPGKLSREQKAALWQLVTGSTSAKNNPYSKSTGQKVLDAYEKEKEKYSD